MISPIFIWLGAVAVITILLILVRLALRWTASEHPTPEDNTESIRDKILEEIRKTSITS